MEMAKVNSIFRKIVRSAKNAGVDLELIENLPSELPQLEEILDPIFEETRNNPQKGYYMNVIDLNKLETYLTYNAEKVVGELAGMVYEIDYMCLVWKNTPYLFVAKQDKSEAEWESYFRREHDDKCIICYNDKIEPWDKQMCFSCTCVMCHTCVYYRCPCCGNVGFEYSRRTNFKLDPSLLEIEQV